MNGLSQILDWDLNFKFMKFFWDYVEEMTVKVEIVGQGQIDGKPLLAIRFGPYTEWVKAEDLHDEEDESLKIKAAQVLWVKKQKAARTRYQTKLRE
jgi:hypothetical protein